MPTPRVRSETRGGVRRRRRVTGARAETAEGHGCAGLLLVPAVVPTAEQGHKGARLFERRAPRARRAAMIRRLLLVAIILA